MDQPELYSRASDVQRHDAIEIVDEYVGLMTDHADGKKSLMDVGTGSGEVLMHILAPNFAQGFTQITGIDKSPKMVEYSEDCYANNERGVHFKELDIEVKQLPAEYYEQFDRVTSFHCLHGIHNQRKSMQNIYKSLRKNGDCLLMFPGSNSVNDAYRALSRDHRWENNVKDLTRVFSPLLDHLAIENEYASLLKEEGFIEARVKVTPKTYTFPGTVRFKDNMKAINVFPLSPEEYEEFFDALCDNFNAMGLRKDIPGSDDHRFIMNYQTVVAYARKAE